MLWGYCPLLQCGRPSDAPQGRGMQDAQHAHLDPSQLLPRALWISLFAPGFPGLWRLCIPSFNPLLFCSSFKPTSTPLEQTQNLRAQREKEWSFKRNIMCARCHEGDWGPSSRWDSCHLPEVKFMSRYLVPGQTQSRAFEPWMNEWDNLKIILSAPLVRIVYRNRTNEGCVYVWRERKRDRGRGRDRF